MSAGGSHPAILPSFVVPLIRSSLRVGSFSVDPAELLSWTRTPLDNRVRTKLRDKAIARLRVGFDPVWEMAIGVRPQPGWERAVSKAEVACIRPLLSELGQAGFAALTLRELRTALGQSVPKLFSLLARIEAVGWVPPPTLASGPLILPEDAQRQPMSAKLRQRALQAAALDWLSSLSPDDLRFPAPANRSIQQALTEEIKGATAAQWLEPLVERLLAANQMTVAQEIEDVANAAFRVTRLSASDAAREKWVGIFCDRYASPSVPPMQDIADRYGLTRERVRQICERFLFALRNRPAVMPRLGEVLELAGQAAPLDEQAMTSALAPQLGGAGISGVLALMRDIGREHVPLQLAAAKTRSREGTETLGVYEAVGEAPWAQAALRYAEKECATMGCTNFEKVAGALVMQDMTPRRASLEMLLQRAVGFRMLEEQSGWFTLSLSESSEAALRVRKMLLIADEISVVEIAEAFATATLWLNRGDGRVMAVPPAHILRDMISGWGWIRAGSNHRLSSREDITPDILSYSEQRVLAVLHEHGGVAWRHEIVAAASEGRAGVSAVAVYNTLSDSPILEDVGHGIYHLRGQALDPQALAAAQERAR